MSTTYCFSVHADAEPSALPRVMEVFARLGHVPTRCHVERPHTAPRSWSSTPSSTRWTTATRRTSPAASTGSSAWSRCYGRKSGACAA